MLKNLDIATFKFLYTFLFASVGAVPITLMKEMEGWYLENHVFVAIILAALSVDYVVGTYNHLFKLRDFSIKKNYSGFLKKGFGVCAGYVLFEMMHQIMQDVDFVAIYFKIIIQLTVFLYPAYSALKNISIFTDGAFPPKIWFSKIEKFNQDLNLDNFKTKNNESTDDLPNVP